MPWMANVLSFTIERNRLLSTMARRNQELDTIRHIGGALASSTFDINQVLNYTMDMIRVAMNTEAGSLMLIKDDELEFAVAYNIKVEDLKGYRIKMGQGIAGYSADRGEVIIENDVQNSPQFHSDVDASTGFTTRSALCVPMISQGKVIGVIEVLNKIDGDFTANDTDLLQSVASSVSIAIENARLYKKTVSLAEHERGIRGMFQKFVPKEILDKILHNTDDKQAVIEEMKTLTLLNIDIRGFTGLTRKIGPQKTVSLLNSFFSVMGGIVFKHNGIVDKYLGDGFLALFGAPVSSTWDADNAISAALEMQTALPRVDDYFVKEIGASVNIGISIHTGEVVVGNFGFDMKMDYTVIGDSVNIVFRLQGLTRSFPNGILISENTSKAARSHLEAREVDIKDGNKGILKGLKVYELLGQNR
jgi:class 3 adenylate cyclase/putative methionine-R-sulfoxide reductase with GAF domain